MTSLSYKNGMERAAIFMMVALHYISMNVDAMSFETLLLTGAEPQMLEHGSIVELWQEQASEGSRGAKLCAMAESRHSSFLPLQ